MTKRIALALALLFAAGLGLAAERQERVVISTTGGPTLAGLAPGGLQPMGTGSGVVFGQVTDSDSNRPVAGALVTLGLQGSQQLRVMADAQGRFGFRDLPAGRFQLSASRPGWVDGAFGRTRPAGPSLSLTLQDGEKVSGVTVPMWKFASIAGTVVDESADPIVNKTVRVLKRTIQGGKIRLVPSSQDATDDRGMFRIGMLEPGEYVVVVPMEQAGAEISLGGDLALAGFAAREAVVREVSAMRVEGAGGRGGAAPVFIGSDDGGRAAGMTEDGRLLSFPTVFYPSVNTAAKATVIAVTSGEERAAIDFQLRAVTTSAVSGTVMGPEGPAGNLQITMVPAEADDMVTNIETLSGFSDNQGRFKVSGVPPGQYVLRAVRTPRMAMGPAETTTIQQGGNVMVFRTAVGNASAPLPTEPTLWAEMSVSVGSKDVADLTVGLRPGVKVTGMVQFNGGAERPTSDRLPSIGVSLEAADTRPGLTGGRGRIETSGQFATVGVPPGKYFIRVAGAPSGWTFHSATVNGRDASVVPIDLEGNDVGGVVIAFTDRPSEFSGDVTGETGAPESVTVLVFPTDTTAWTGYGSASRRFASTRVGKDGKFRLTNLPAGEYFAVAIPDRLTADWQNPKSLESLASGAARVRVRDGDQITQSLKVSR